MIGFIFHLPVRKEILALLASVNLNILGFYLSLPIFDKFLGFAPWADNYFFFHVLRVFFGIGVKKSFFSFSFDFIQPNQTNFGCKITNDFSAVFLVFGIRGWVFFGVVGVVGVGCADAAVSENG